MSWKKILLDLLISVKKSSSVQKERPKVNETEDVTDVYEKCFYCWLKYLTWNIQLRMLTTKCVDENGMPIMKAPTMAYKRWDNKLKELYIERLTKHYKINPKVVRSALAVAGALKYKQMMQMIKDYEYEITDMENTNGK